MAYLWKKPNSKYWQAGFYDKAGKRRNSSTRLPAKKGYLKQAQRIADQFEHSAMLERASAQVKTTIANFHKELTGEDLPDSTLRAHCEAWLKKKRLVVADSSVSAYTTTINNFIKSLGTRADLDIHLINEADIIKFQEEMAIRVSASTVNNRIKILRAIFQDAVRKTYLKNNPVMNVEGVKSDTKRVKRGAFSVDQVKLILENATDEWKSMIIFGFYTGQRLGDIVNLRWENIDLKSELISITTAKTEDELEIPIPDPLKKYILSLNPSDNLDAVLHPIAYERHKKASGKTATLSNQFGKLLENVGLREKTTHASTGKGRSAGRKTHKLSFHSLRHTYISNLKNKEVSGSTVRAMVGHKSVEVNEGYTHVEKKVMKRATKKLPDLWKSD